MSEISCRVFEFFERHAETYGYSLEELVDGSGATLEVLQDPAQRVPWEAWAAICERFEQLVGGPDETVRAGAQIIGMLGIFVWVFAASLVVWFALKALIGIRISEEDEEMGADVSETGIEAYPEFAPLQ